MISVLLISHGNMAEAMVDSAKMVMGKQPQLEGLALLPEDSAERFREKLKNKVEEIDTGDGLIILSDFPLGTPFNTAVQAQAGYQHLTGMSMPMLLRILRDRSDPTVSAEVLCERALASARQDGIFVNQFVKELRDRKQ